MTDPCEPASLTGGKVPGAGLVAYDATPEVEAALQVTSSFALGEGAASGLTVQGSGRVSARADEAYVLAWVQTSFGPTGPRPIEERDRAELLRRLGALGIAGEDVEFVSPGPGSPTIVAVEVEPGRVPQRGDEVLDAIEAVLGRADQRGVLFSHSNCLGVLAEAQKQALADARARVDGLAAAAGLRVGGVRGLADGVLTPYGPPLFDPCSDDLSNLVYGGAGLQLKAFDAEPLVDMRTSLRVTYALER